MRQHLRFLLLRYLAAAAAGCSNSDNDNNGGSNSALSPAAELCGSIGDRVWLDENANGIQDDGEPGVEGVTVEARICGGGLAATTTTDANGAYLFENLDDTFSYRLCFFAPTGMTWTTPNQGARSIVPLNWVARSSTRRRHTATATANASLAICCGATET